MNSESLQQSILQTLAYFDLHNFPLSKEELFRFLWKPLSGSFEDMAGISCNLYLHGRIVTQGDFVFLPGREIVIEKRRQAIVETEKKLRIARRAARLIRSVPFLRAVYVCNSVAMGTSTEESDIDFFIITAPKRVWIVRLFTNVILKLFRLRVDGRHAANRACLSFFVDTEHLNLESLKIAEDDIYLTYWVHQLVSLYDPKDYHEKFIQANNWTGRFLQNCIMPTRSSVADSADGLIGRAWKRGWEAMWQGAYGGIIERQARELQLSKMKLSLKEKADAGRTDVVLSEGIIKLHENDARLQIRNHWLEKTRELV